MERREKRRRHRGPRKKKRSGGILSTIILIIAVAVFCVSAFQLYKIASGYQKGRGEYDDIKELVLKNDEEKDKPFKVDFEELSKINPDTVGWIRFSPEPAQINYPVVQGQDNDKYLNTTFSENENTVGAIFLNIYNKPDFNDRNTIVYGHRMNDNSMFHDLEKYKDKKFWESNPYFYMYTPDGREITYHIYTAGVVKDTSDIYITEFESDEAFENYLKVTKEACAYDTGIELQKDAQVVTLSTCTKESNDDRFVVIGVKKAEKAVE